MPACVAKLLARSFRSGVCFARQPPPARLHRRRQRCPASAAAHEAASSQQAGLLPPSFLDNPAIAQRETLRSFYSASSIAEQLGIVQAAAARGPAVLNVHTALHLLCHAAELSIKGMQPVGGTEQQGAVLLALHSALAPHVGSMSPPQLGALLWSIAAVGYTADWTDELVVGVAVQELQRGRLPSYNSKELTSLIYAFGRLVRRYDPSVHAFATALISELSRRMEQQPYVRGALSSTDMADLASAAAALYVTHAPPAAAPVAASAAAAPEAATPTAAVPPPEEVHTLLAQLAEEVRRQLANKNSTISPFSPPALVQYLQSYAALQHRTSPQMLDVVSSWICHRIRHRHINSVARPCHLSAVLEAYADLQHCSISTPQLLAAAGDQVRRLAAQQQERATGGGGGAAAAEAPVPAATPGPHEDLELPELNSILLSHLRLGYAPPPLLLTAVQPGVMRQLPSAPPGEVAFHLHLLSLVPGYSPGPVAVGLLLARAMAIDDETGERLPEEAVAALQRDAENLGWRPAQ